MEKQIPEYPTHEQIEKCFEAYKKDGQTGILEFLKKQRAKISRLKWSGMDPPIRSNWPDVQAR
jgi:hypothetical protein